MSEQDDNFLSRWSRRKAQVRQGVQPPPAAPAVVLPFPAPVAKAGPPASTPEPAAAGAVDAVAQGPAPAATEGAAPAAPPKPTLEDVEALTAESDYSRFIARDVDEKVKNSAMKKLFTDPHYNVMDGLDTYIADYNTPDPLPKSMLRQLVQARMLGLLDDEMPEQPAAEEMARAAAAETAATSNPAQLAARVEDEVVAENPAEPAAFPPAGSSDGPAVVTAAAVPDAPAAQPAAETPRSAG